MTWAWWAAIQWVLAILWIVLAFHVRKLRLDARDERDAHSEQVASLGRLMSALIDAATFHCAACGQPIESRGGRLSGVVVRRDHSTNTTTLLHGLCAPPLVGATDVYM